MTFLAILLGLSAAAIVIGGLYAMCSTPPSPKRMSYDEEVEWLKSQGLSQKEAEEIADL